jgi:glycosyltransferase involved in cell wall biosynthesis
MPPLISIVTPCLNRVRLIAEAIESAMQPDYPDVEHLVIDGGSTDGTLELLKRYPHLRVISEPDQGVYDALNKGLRLARGPMIGFLNTDDCYAPGVLAQAADCLIRHPQAWAAAGDADLFLVDADGTRRQIMTFPAIPPEQLWSRLTIGVPAFNAWFFRAELFKRLGRFNLAYPLSADREFMLRLGLSGLPYATFEGLAYCYRQHQGSLTTSGNPDPGAPYTEPPYILEKRLIAEAYLEDPTLPPDIRPVMRHWHADITSGQVLYALRRGQLRWALAHAGVGWRRNLAWPVEFASRIFAGLLKQSHRTRG